jgi:hypothetical protein
MCEFTCNVKHLVPLPAVYRGLPWRLQSCLSCCRFYTVINTNTNIKCGLKVMSGEKIIVRELGM